MKKFFMILLGKFAKKHVKEINKAQKWIDSAQAQFASAVEEAELAEIQFEKVAQARLDEAEKLLKLANEAKVSKEQAVKFKNKLKQFIEE